MSLSDAIVGAPPKAVVRCHIFSTGYCLASEHHLLRGGRRARLRWPALVALLEHPAAGRVLFDTGYSAGPLDMATKRLPYRLYRLAAPYVTLPEESAVRRMQDRFGVAAADIDTIIVSHFHPDHLGGAADFPHARFVATAAAYADIAEQRGFAALRRAYLPALLPAAFAARADLLPTPFTGDPLPHLGPTHDLLGDGSLRLVALPGHAVGQIGLLAATEEGPALFIADAAYMRRSVREDRLPHRITERFTDNPAEIAETLTRLHLFAQERPDVRIVPTHCPEVLAEVEDGC